MITVRAATEQDTAFFQQVYASTRIEEIGLTGWSAEQTAAFLQLQYRAQQQHYETVYPTAAYYVIQQAEQSIGRLILDRTRQEILLMEIALLPSHRNRGFGTQLLQALQAEAHQGGQSIRLSVKTFNPALRLYQRLGFTPIADTGIYVEMIWPAGGAGEPSTGQRTEDKTHD